MGIFQDLTGLQFGGLLVLGVAYKKPRKPHGSIIYWRCRCLRCGNECIVRGCDLTRKDGKATVSCGCLRADKTSERMTTHGMSNTKIFRIWAGIIKRCYNPKCKAYPNYGGRGIKVCERWHTFENFYADVSVLPHFGEKGYSLDRRDNNGDYCPENCRFATRKQQNRNTRRNAKVVFEGEEMTLAEAAEKSGIRYGVLNHRYQRGDRDERLFRPVKK